METKQNFFLKTLILIFVIITIFYVFYASCSQRGLYLDGSYWLVLFLNRFSNNSFSIHSYTEHPRYMVFFLEHLPITLVGYFFRNFTDKITYSIIYSFTMFLIPVLGLWWNIELTKRTKQYAVCFFSIFTYTAMILLYQIFCVVETTIGLPFQFVLLNYLLGKIKYTKLDKIGIFLILILMFGIYEHTIFLGFIIFATMFTCLYDEEDPDAILTKIIIGAGSLAAATYTIFFTILSSEELSQVVRFFKESIDFFPLWNKLNFFIAAITVIFGLGIWLFQKNKPLTSTFLFVVSAVYLSVFMHMTGNLQVFLDPIHEQHMRSIPVWAVPLIFGLIFYARLKKFPENKEFFEKLYIPVLLCGITLSAWQIVTTFYWNENVGYMKECIKNCDQPLYSPSVEKDKEIASFFSPTLRRFIWNANFVSTALALEPKYEITTMIMHPDEKLIDPNNPSKRGQQFVVADKGFIGMPYDEIVDIKNKFWDLTVPAKALDKYNRTKAVETNEEEFEDYINSVYEQKMKKHKLD